MTRDDIIRMARECSGDGSEMLFSIEEIEHFATLVAAAEREACAKVCRSEADRALWNFKNDISQNQYFWNGAEQMASGCESAIRARR